MSDSPPQAELNALEGLFDSGRPADVIDRGEKLLTRFPESFILCQMLGAANGMLGRDERAAQYMRKALDLQPDFAIGYLNLGVALDRLGRREEAVASYQRVLRLLPDCVEAHFCLGSTLHALGRLDEAVSAYGHALQNSSDHIEACYNLGGALQTLGRRDEAIACYRRVLEINPAFAEAHLNLGILLQGLGRLDDASGCFWQALQIKPDFAEARLNLVACCEAVLQLEPHHAEARSYKLYQQAHMCDWDAIQSDANLIPDLGVSGQAVPPFNMLSFDDDPARNRRRSERYAAREYPRWSPPTGIRQDGKANRIRIGYFSADFHEHAVMHCMARLFELHDRSRFSVHLFSYGPDSDSEMRRRLKEAADAFHEVGALTDDAVAAFARSQQIDIAVDLMGYTNAHRLGIFACRAAPIQISYLGFPGTLGTQFIDYIVADRVVIPEQARRHYSEKILFLPGSYQVNDDRRAIADRMMTRAEMGLPEDGFIFCCFNNTYKITPAEYDIWMRLLDQVEGSVLWLYRANSLAENNLRKEAQKRGIDADRLVFGDRLSLPDHMARHRLADLFLDTFNYNGHATTSNALWAGLPVVTRLGRGFAARVSSSLLNAVGLPELITQTSTEYESLALALARDPDRLSQIRAKLASNRLTAPLFDAKLSARYMEAAYERAYAIHLEGRRPADIVIEQVHVPAN